MAPETEGSNPSSSSGESTNHQFRRDFRASSDNGEEKPPGRKAARPRAGIFEWISSWRGAARGGRPDPPTNHQKMKIAKNVVAAVQPISISRRSSFGSGPRR